MIKFHELRLAFHKFWQELDKPLKMMWFMLWLSVLSGSIRFIFPIPAIGTISIIVGGLALGFAFGLLYTYRCLWTKYDQVNRLQKELLALKMQWVEQSLTDTLSFFEKLAEQDEEEGETVH